MILNEYETTYITRPELAEEVQTRLLEKLSGVIKTYGGDIFIHDAWGRRKLAYPIKKHNHGYYVYLNYVGPADLPRELERLLRLDDQVIRYLTVKLGFNVDAEAARTESQGRHQRWVERRSVAQQAPTNNPDKAARA